MKKILSLTLCFVFISCASSSYQELKEKNKNDYETLNVGAKLSTAYSYSMKMLKKCYIEEFNDAGQFGNSYSVEAINENGKKGITLTVNPVMGSKKIAAYLEFTQEGKRTVIKIYGWGMNGGQVKEKLKSKKC